MSKHNTNFRSRDLQKFLLPNLQGRKKGFFFIGLVICCLWILTFFYILLLSSEIIILVILAIPLIFILVLIGIAIHLSKTISISLSDEYLELKTIFSKKRIHYLDIIAWNYTYERKIILRKRGTAFSGYIVGHFSAKAMIENQKRYYSYIYVFGSKNKEEGFILKTKMDKYYCISVNKEEINALELILEEKIGHKNIELGGILLNTLTSSKNSRAKLKAIIIPLTSIILIWIFYTFLFFGLSSLKRVPLHWGFTGVDYWGSIYELLFIPIILTVLNMFFLRLSYHYHKLIYQERGFILLNLFLLGITIGIILLLLFLYLPYLCTI